MSIYSQKTYFKDVCKKCGKTMEIDDVDFRFRGCQDEYYYCPNCDTHLHVKIRYGSMVSTKWFLGVPYSTVKTN